MRAWFLFYTLCCILHVGHQQVLPTIAPDNSSFYIPDSNQRKVIVPPIIIQQSMETTIAFRQNEAFELVCIADGIPEPTYSWFWNEKVFDPSGMDGRIAIQPGVGTLIFANPLPIDEAIYQCIAKNQAGTSVSIKYNVRLAILDDFVSSNVKINTPEIGGELKLECLPPRSFPNPVVYWGILKDGLHFTKLDYTDRISQDPIGNLIITNVVADDYRDNATYVCVARNEVMRTFKQGKPNKIYPSGVLAVLHKPQLAWQSPTQQFGVRGKSISMMCIFFGNPTPRVMWKRSHPTDRGLPEFSEIRSFGQELVFTNLQYEDQGTYECEGINDEGLVPVRRSFTLVVESAPYFVEKPQSQNVEEFSTVEFKCVGESSPQARVLWYLNGVISSNVPRNPRIILSQNKATFVNVTVKDAMVIQCNISNKHGYNFTNAYLNVLIEPPNILQKPVIGQKAAEGQTVDLACDVAGSPRPYVVWTKGGEQLTGGRFQVQPNGNMRIMDLSLVDAGAYMCTATNKFGVDEATGTLIVRRRTQIVVAPKDLMVYTETESKLTCTATTDSEEIDNLVITWKKDDQVIDYRLAGRVEQNIIDNSLTISGAIYLDTGKYTCSASNGIDTDEKSANLIVQAPPNPPNQVQVRCYNNENQAEIWWQPGKENFAPILNFIVQYNTSFQPDLWYDIASNVSQNQRRIVVTMSPWGNYSFRVLARNKIGISLPSQQSFNICTTQPGVPVNNPQDVIGEGDEPGNLVIFWTPMPKIEQNGPDFKYLISWIQLDLPGAAMNTEVVGTTEAWHFIVRQRYQPYQRFNVSVKASNARGDSNANLKWVVGYSGEDIPKVTPNDVRVVEETLASTSVNLTWTHVDTSPGSIVGLFRGYRVEYATADNYPFNVRFQDFIMSEAAFYPRKRIMKRDVVNNTLSFQVTGLPPNSDIVAVVRVLNKYYAGPVSQRVTFRTPEGAPGPPQMLNVLVQGATHFVLKWVIPKETNGRLLGYNITYQAIKGMNIGELQYYESRIDETETMAKATGLNPNTTYRIYVSAFTMAGKGDPIFVDSVTSPSGAPDPPTFTIVDLNDTFANITWQPSRSGVPGSVFYVQYKPRYHYDWLRSPDEYMDQHMSLRSLDPGTTYQVRVVAKNGDGFEAASVWQEFLTPGVAPGYFELKTSAWFYGIWISLFLIIVGLILFFVLQKYTDEKWDEKEAEIEEEIRRLQAEEAAERMGIFNAEALGQVTDHDFESRVPLKSEPENEFYKVRPMQYETGGAQSHEYPQYGYDYSGGYKDKSSPQSKTDTFV